MRVVLGSAFPLDETLITGGVEAVAYYLASVLARRSDMDLHVVSCSERIARDFVERRGNMTIHWIKIGQRFHNFRIFTDYARRVARAYQSIHPDIIHAHGFNEYAVKIMPGQRLILSIHGLETLVPNTNDMHRFRGAPGFYRKATGKLIAEQCIQNAAGIISNAGNYTLAHFPGLSSRKKIFAIANPIASDFFTLKRDSKFVSTHCHLLWAGIIAERKNLLGVIYPFSQIVREHPDVHLTLAGQVWDQWYYEKIRQAITELGMDGNVTITGPISQSAMMDLYASADIFILPSIEETAPMAVAQAMAVGLPVIASRVGGIPWMLDDGRSGLLEDPHDHGGWFNSMKRLVNSDEVRREFGALAKRRAGMLFDPGVVEGQIVSAYEHLLSDGQARVSL